MVLSHEVQLVPNEPPDEKDSERAIFWDSQQGIYFAYTKRQVHIWHLPPSLY
jgi:hypothetical protein